MTYCDYSRTNFCRWRDEVVPEMGRKIDGLIAETAALREVEKAARKVNDATRVFHPLSAGALDALGRLTTAITRLDAVRGKR